jgi:1-phosphatidylinositol-4-phosphate 5-kinase
MVPAESSKGSKGQTCKRITQDHESFELIFDMLMGIRTAVGRFTSAAMPDEIGPAEFNQSWEGDFLARGTPETPAHHQSDFKFKDYSPLVFRQLRERFGITSQDYMLSLTSEYVLVEMSTNSKSGSFFFYSADYRFVLKTCTKREAAFLMAALPPYHQHLMTHRFTLLCRFFGLHRVQHRSGRMVYFVVMGNVFPIDKPIHERYDLKGSTRNRFTTDAERADPNVVLKDLDFINARRKLLLGHDKKRRLLAQIKKDCELLERLEVTDYSVLIGVHRVSSNGRKISRGKCLFYKVGTGANREGGAACQWAAGSAAADGEVSKRSIPSDLSPGAARCGAASAACADGLTAVSDLRSALPQASEAAAPAAGSTVGGDAGCRAAADGGGGVGDGVRPSVGWVGQEWHPALESDGAREGVRGGGPGVASCSADVLGGATGAASGGEATRPEPAADVNKEVYYMGVIDILCEYGFKKQIEHSYKAAKYGEKVGYQNFSVVDPSQYSQRFQNFIEASIA